MYTGKLFSFFGFLHIYTMSLDGKEETCCGSISLTGEFVGGGGGGGVTPGTYLEVANNLSDVADVPTSRTNLGLGTTDDVTFNTLTAVRLYNTGDEVTLGFESGQTGFSGTTGVAIGRRAGQTNSNANSVNVGLRAGQTNAGLNSINVGRQAGNTSSGTNSVNLGYLAGNNLTGLGAVNVGYNSGANNSQNYSVNVGYDAGRLRADEKSINIGYQAGEDQDSVESINIGTGAGQFSAGVGQGTYSINIGTLAASIGTNDYAINIGYNSGQNSGTDSISIGRNAGLFGIASGSIAIGANAGPQSLSNPNTNISIGASSGPSPLTDGQVAVGTLTGGDGIYTTAIGSFSQMVGGNISTAVGFGSGQVQGTGCVAVGGFGGIEQGDYSICVGENTLGDTLGTPHVQGIRSVAILQGDNHTSDQGDNSILISSSDGATASNVNNVVQLYTNGADTTGAGKAPVVPTVTGNGGMFTNALRDVDPTALVSTLRYVPEVDDLRTTQFNANTQEMYTVHTWASLTTRVQVNNVTAPIYNSASYDISLHWDATNSQPYVVIDTGYPTRNMIFKIVRRNTGGNFRVVATALHTSGTNVTYYFDGTSVPNASIQSTTLGSNWEFLVCNGVMDNLALRGEIYSGGGVNAVLMAEVEGFRPTP